MLDLKYIRENREKVKTAAKNKNRKVDIDTLLTLDDTQSDLHQKVQRLREEKNKIAGLGKDAASVKGKEIKENLKKLGEELRTTEAKIAELILQIPNVPLDEVPVGAAKENKELRTCGVIKKFDFTPKSHLELGKSLDLIDTERGSKVAGFRGYFLKNELALLQTALLTYAFQKLAAKGFAPVTAPAIVKSFALEGTGQFPWGKPEVYELNDEDAYLSGTAEVPMTAFHAGETLPESELPKKYVVLSPCFRREVGSYGRDTKGLYRVHEFFKVEQVVLAENDLTVARELHEQLQKNAEEILQELEIPYRVLLMSTGEMGEPQILKYDTESWMPSRNSYGETMSNSIMGDFQTRRLKIRYKNNDGKTNYCFSLNNTALASPRILIPLLENHQQKDGSVHIPKVLHQYTGFAKIPSK